MADQQTVDLTRQQDGGAVKTVLQPGHKFVRPVEGDWLNLHYTCTLASGPEAGRVIEDHFEKGVIVILGQSTVLPAVGACLRSMQHGERCELLVKATHAYGEAGTDRIPPNSQLRFIIDLRDVRGVDVTEERDGGVRKSILKASKKNHSPSNGTQVQIRMRRLPDDLSSPEGALESFCFTLGRARRTPGLCAGIDVALRSMRKGELARCAFSADWGWPGAEGGTHCELELTDFEKYKEIWKMNTEEKLSQSCILKAKAARFVQEGLPEVALPLYHRVVSYLEGDVGFSDPQERAARHSLLLACRLNAALCHFRQAQFASCSEQCSLALQLEPLSEKALFRRAQARQMLGESLAAVKDLKQLLAKYPANSAAKTLLASCEKSAREEKDREKQLCRAVFENVEAWGDPVSASAYGSCGQFQIDNWSNDLAAGMLSIPQELEAFGEEMPEIRHRHHSQGSGDG